MPQKLEKWEAGASSQGGSHDGVEKATEFSHPDYVLVNVILRHLTTLNTIDG